MAKKSLKNEGDRSMKLFELYVGDGTVLPLAEIPERLRS